MVGGNDIKEMEMKSFPVFGSRGNKKVEICKSLGVESMYKIKEFISYAFGVETIS